MGRNASTQPQTGNGYPVVGQGILERRVLNRAEVGASVAYALPRRHRSANAMAGAWSMGASDRNLADHIVDIAYE